MRTAPRHTHIIAYIEKNCSEPRRSCWNTSLSGYRLTLTVACCTYICLSKRSIDEKKYPAPAFGQHAEVFCQDNVRKFEGSQNRAIAMRYSHWCHLFGFHGAAVKKRYSSPLNYQLVCSASPYIAVVSKVAPKTIQNLNETKDTKQDKLDENICESNPNTLAKLNLDCKKTFYMGLGGCGRSVSFLKRVCPLQDISHFSTKISGNGFKI